MKNASHLSQDDYHIITPDLRGFGPSTHPGDVESSGNMADMVDDLVCALEHANVHKVACIGCVLPPLRTWGCADQPRVL